MLQLGTAVILRLRAFSRARRIVLCGLTFDMRGGRQPAKPDVARPLDGRVSPQIEECTAQTGRLLLGDHGCNDARLRRSLCRTETFIRIPLCCRRADYLRPSATPLTRTCLHCSSFRDSTIFADSVTALTRNSSFLRHRSDSRRPLQERTVRANVAGCRNAYAPSATLPAESAAPL